MSSRRTLNYAIPPSPYFWKWSDDDSSVEFEGGSTLCLREEVLTLLSTLAEEDGIPPLGSVLMVLAACNGSHQAILDWMP